MRCLWFIVATCGGLLPLGCGARVDSICGDGTYDDNGTCRPVRDSGSCAAAGGDCSSTDGGTRWMDASASTDDASASLGADGSVGGDASLDSSFGIDTSTACLKSDNTFVIAGDDWVYSGPPVVVEGGIGWTANASDEIDGLASWVEVDISPNWHVTVSSNSIGAPLAPGVYNNAENAYATEPNRPGLYVTSGGACNQLDGSFTIQEIASDPNAGYPNVQSITASWVQRCEGQTGWTVGCVHFAR